LANDFIDDFFTLDSRLFKTIIPLLFKPGFLTLEYNKGRRVKYLPPLRMYLVLSVLIFLIPSDRSMDNEPELNLGDDVKIQETKDSKFTLLGANDFVVDLSKLKSNEAYKDSVIQTMWQGSKEHWAFFILGERRTKNLLGNCMNLLKNKENRNAFVLRYISKIPNMMFVLLPLFALLLSFFFRKQNMLYVQTLVFSLHFHSFFFFVLCLKQLMDMFFYLPKPIVFILIAAFPFIYFIIALKKVYKQSYGMIILKAPIILSAYGMLLTLGLSAIAFLLLLF